MNILFYGDSITDAGRDRSDPASLGDGYASRAAALLLASTPGKNLAFENFGVSGDRTCDLLRRLDADVLSRKPDLVVMMIGINDVWRRYDANDPTSPEAFLQNCERLVGAILASGAKLVLLEPFLLPNADKPFREDLDPKLAVIRAIARSRRLTLVPLDGLLNAAAAGGHLLSDDGIHPNEVGADLIARHCAAAVAPLL